MARPSRCRKICLEPAYGGFAPKGGETDGKITLSVDEYETVRLIDLEHFTHGQAAEQMGISRTTVTAIYESARAKLADCIVNGKCLEICGGNYNICNGTGRCLRKGPCIKGLH